METRTSRPLIASLTALLLLGGTLATSSSADVIVLDNGSRFTGTVTGLAGDTVTITSDYADPIKIKRDRIIRITTDKPVDVHLKSGEVLKGALNTGEGERVSVEPGEGRGAATIDWKNVAAINPPPIKNWSGNVSVAGNYQTGNTDRSALAAGVDALWQGERDRFGLRFLYGIAEEDGSLTSRSAFGALKFDHFFTKKFYGYLGVEMLNDKFKDLNLRTVIGPGVGYQVWDDPIKSLALEAGIAYFSEDLKKGKDNRWLTARLAGNFRYQLTDSIVFTDQLVLYPSLETMSDFKMRNEAAIATALGSRWSLRLANILDYDNDPPTGVKSTDSNFLLGLQYGF